VNSNVQAPPILEAIGGLDLPEGGGKTLLAELRDQLSRKLGSEDHVGRTPQEIFATATSGVSGLDSVLNDLISGPIIKGFHAASDSTLGWTVRGELPDYRPHQVAVVDTPLRLPQVVRGTSAAHVAFGMTGPEEWRIAKFGLQFVIDEQDVISRGLRLAPLQLALAEVGAAAGRLIPDLVWALILTNPTLADNVALFHASRNNLGADGATALASATLKAAYGAIGGQIPTDRDGNPVHLNLTPRYLVTSPGIVTTGRELARLLATGENDLIVRSESRISSTGVFDPLSEDIITTDNVDWLLAAPAEQAPSILVGALEGIFKPRIRSGNLDRGQWGKWFDIEYSVGVCAVSGRGLYFGRG
jgi:hypothetical protein